MKLYELAEQYRADVAKLQDLDLPPEVVLDTIDGMQGDISEKIKAVVIVATEIEAESKVRVEHGKRMLDSGKAMAHRAEGLRSYAQIAIQNSGLMLPIKYPEFSVNLQKNPPSCEITDEKLLAPHLKTVEVVLQVNPGAPVSDLQAALEGLASTSLIKGYEILVTPDKRAALETLKTLQQGDVLPGARMNPTAYRLVVK